MKHRRLVHIAVLLLALFLIVGCAPARAPLREERAPAGAVDRDAASPEEAPQNVAVEDSTRPIDPDSPYTDQAALETSMRMIIRNVSLTMTVKDVQATSVEIMNSIAQYKGYVSDSKLWKEGDRVLATVTLRVPAENLDLLLNSIRAKAVTIESEIVTTDDVSQEYVDLTSRLRNLEATEQQLLKVLDEIYTKTYKADDILTIYREITSVRNEIEKIKGRQQYLSQLSSLATVDVALQSVAKPPVVIEEGKWNPMVSVNESLKRLVTSLQNIYDVVVSLVITVLPILIILALPFVILFLIIRAVARRRKARGATKTE
ncbi:MAG: DUF4349 domain-containing protein [Chloroflexi bacterium]|nr:DUF4349 domain-containing protein [Chloroflexota bacterium]